MLINSSRNHNSEKRYPKPYGFSILTILSALTSCLNAVQAILSEYYHLINTQYHSQPYSTSTTIFRFVVFVIATII